MPELSLPSTPPAIMAGSLPLALSKIMYDRKSAAWALSLSPRALNYLIANKQRNARRLGKKVMITYSELIKFSKADHFLLAAAPASSSVM